MHNIVFLHKTMKEFKTEVNILIKYKVKEW